jgi:hypothetical protein
MEQTLAETSSRILFCGPESTVITILPNNKSDRQLDYIITHLEMVRCPEIMYDRRLLSEQQLRLNEIMYMYVVTHPLNVAVWATSNTPQICLLHR